MLVRPLFALSLVALSAGSALAAVPAFPAADAFPALGQPPTVEILTPGKGKAAPLRWKAQKGASEQVSMTLDTKMAITVAGESMPMDMTLRMDMDGQVLDTTPDGGAVVSMTVTDTDLKMPGLDENPEAAAMVRGMLRGLVLEATMDARGAITKSEVRGASEAMQAFTGQMDSSLEQLAIPFPEGPVAVGATWRALSTQQTNGMTVRMVTTYKLVKLAGNVGTVEVGVVQEAAAQTMEMNGTKAELESLSSTGSGEMTFDLTRPMFAKAKVSVDMEARMNVMGQAATMKVTARVGMAPRGTK